MKKYFKLLISCLLMITTLTGCWSYVGLSEISIVAGVSIDYDEVHKQYIMNFEIIDTLGTSKEEGVKSIIYEVRGDSVFGAVHNAKEKIANKLYFGNCNIIIVCHNLAKTKGILEITDFFMRDPQPREEIHLVISKEKSAKEILIVDQYEEMTSPYINELLVGDAMHEDATIAIPMYEVYDILQDGKQSVVLPVVGKATEGETTVVEVGGIAIFKDDKFLGFIESEESRALLIATNRMKKGALSFDLTGDGENDTSMQIVKSKTKPSFSFENGKITYHLDVELVGTLVEMHDIKHPITEKQILKLQEKMEQTLVKKVENIVKLSQVKFKSDFIGIGRTIYKQDLKLWKQLEPQWEKYFLNADVDVKCKITITGTGLID